ncbi:YigZ family protein [Alkalicella caledoniensis]|uniref:YigZ family protein n=1 Tax=Alkalicella caledoniensis TaxID=2731377 RepID=A0A7G9WAC2_ALKCA|nr:YigZ family protein [Alkalicella caledoniensis]QNO15634.1 YigZ family protein [Alkalicella caledoniensis]
MLKKYYRLKDLGVKEIIINKSRFIGLATPIESEEQALEIIQRVKKEHYNANHNVYAYQIGENDEIQRANDDGEPSGTAGKPVLEIIKKENLKNTLIIVTRYFGGIKLGSGGLIRAYAQCAKEGIMAAKKGYNLLMSNVTVFYDYTFHGKIENYLQNFKYVIGSEFTDRVAINILLDDVELDTFTQEIKNLTSGQSEIHINNQEYVFVEEVNND